MIADDRLYDRLRSFVSDVVRVSTLHILLCKMNISLLTDNKGYVKLKYKEKRK